MPQVPGQGSMHLRLEHALLAGQSELDTHSGRHCEYGSPKYPRIHLHVALLFLGEQLAFAPQGLGKHGLIGPSVGFMTSGILLH